MLHSLVSACQALDDWVVVEDSIEAKLERKAPPPAKKGESELKLSHLDRLIRSLGRGPVWSVLDLVHFIEDGRRHLLDKPGKLAQEAGIPYHLALAIISSREFHRLYFDHINKQVFKPDILEEGMHLLAQDFTDPEVSTRDRLAIFNTLKELFGLAPTQKVEHEVKGQATFEIRLKVQATPNDLIHSPDDVIDVSPDAMALDDGDPSRRVPDALEPESVARAEGE